jgi:hypothetical protein
LALGLPDLISSATLFENAFGVSLGSRGTL